MQFHVGTELKVSEEVEEKPEECTEPPPPQLGAIVSETDSATIYDTAKPGIETKLVYKCFHKPLSRGGKERFDEICASAKALDHPNLSAVFEYGIADDGNAYVISEKAQGTQLSLVLAARGALNGVTATAVFTQILDALEYAVSQKVSIGDLAPDRIFVTGLDTDAPVVKITSVGITRNAFEQDDSAKSLVGDVAAAQYASPERCLGKATDQRSIVYSVGCMLYEVVFGKRAFAGTDPIKLLFEHVNETNVTFPGLTKPGFARFWPLVNKCMLTNPDQRFKDIATLRHHIEYIEEPIKNEREATLMQQVAMRATGARTPLGSEVFIVCSLALALLCTGAVIRRHVHDCDKLEKRVQKLMSSQMANASSEEMIHEWKAVQLRGLQLGQPLSFFADCDMQIGTREQAENSRLNAMLHYSTAAKIYHRSHMYQEELNALDSAVSLYFVGKGAEPDLASAASYESGNWHFAELLPMMTARVRLARKLGEGYSVKRYMDELADLFAQNGEWGKTYDAINEFLTQYPDVASFDDWYRMGTASEAQGDRKQALMCYRKALDEIKTYQDPDRAQNLQTKIDQLELQKQPASSAPHPRLISPP